jgi:Transglutaminase-like superfamily
MNSSTGTLDESSRQVSAAAAELSAHPERPIESWGPDSKMRKFSNAVLFLQILAFAAVVPYLLRLKLTKVGGLLEPRKIPAVVPEDRVRKITGYIETAIRHGRPFVRRGCLTRGLTRYFFLRRAGIDVALCFGMGRLDGGFMGHCWLVKDGEPFLESEYPRPLYKEMYRISRPGSQASLCMEPSGNGRLPNV